jgi:hypothetical protein
MKNLKSKMRPHEGIKPGAGSALPTALWTFSICHDLGAAGLD